MFAGWVGQKLDFLSYLVLSGQAGIEANSLGLSDPENVNNFHVLRSRY